MMKAYVRRVLGFFLFLFGVHRLLLRGKAVIVAFHSVNDFPITSTVNCRPALFRRYCKFFRRYFTVITLKDLLERLRDGRSIDRCLVITFDDGYKDNSQIAAPILYSMALPATFFVTTGFISSDTIAPWDADLSIESSWMTWDEVIGLARQNFDIGGHTVTHASLADISKEDASREINECKSSLELRLKQEVRHFAYPFGGSENISDIGINLVREADFNCCVSCHGGTVDISDSPHRLSRVPLTSRHMSPYEFGFDLVNDNIR